MGSLDFDYSNIVEFSFESGISGVFIVPPNKFMSYSIKISNLRIISKSKGETSQASSQSFYMRYFTFEFVSILTAIKLPPPINKFIEISSWLELH